MADGVTTLAPVYVGPTTPGLISLSDPSWGEIILAGQTSPGIAEVQRPTRPYNWDVKGGKGANGALVTAVGKHPAKFSVIFTVWTDFQMQAWEDFSQLLVSDPTKGVIPALSIYHPALADPSVAISSVVVEEVGGWEGLKGGIRRRTIKFLEYAPPPPVSAVSTPLGTTTALPSADISQDPGVASALAKRDAALADLAAASETP